MSTTYPYWDIDNRYLTAGVPGQDTIYGDVVQHPSGYYRIRCRGAQCQCPIHSKLTGYFYTVADAQAALETHCLDVHFVVEGPVIPPYPVITNLNPNTAAGGTSALAIVITGTDFYTGYTVLIDGSAVPATVVSQTEIDLTWNVPAGAGTNQFAIHDTTNDRVSDPVIFTRT